MKLSINDQNIINLRDLEFENKVWKNKLEYLINEIQIHTHHIESYQLEMKNSLIAELLDESILQLKTGYEKAIALEKKVQVQEEEIPHYIKDFPINSYHELYEEHHILDKEIGELYKESKENIQSIRNSLTGIFAVKKLFR